MEDETAVVWKQEGDGIEVAIDLRAFEVKTLQLIL